MPTITIRPNGFLGGSATLFSGQPTAWQTLADDLDTDYITDPTVLAMALADVALPAGAIVTRVAIRARTLKAP